VVLTYQGIKQYSLAQKLEQACEMTPTYLADLIKRLLDKGLAKDQIIEVLGSEHNALQDCMRETVEVIQDGALFEGQLSEEAPDGAVEETVFPPDG